MRHAPLAAVPLALLLSLALGPCAPALAADKKKDGAQPVADQFIDVVPIALPVIVNGVVRNYIFVKLRVNLAPGADGPKLRDKEPYLRDALIHAAYHTPFTASDSLIKLDEAKLAGEVANQARILFGAKAVGQIAVTSQDPLHVSNLGRRS